MRQPNGRFHGEGTGCLGDYGSMSGDWERDGDMVYVLPSTATDLFLPSPRTSMKLVFHDGQPERIPMDSLECMGQHRGYPIPIISFLPTDGCVFVLPI